MSAITLKRVVDWTALAAPPPLLDGDVHVWRVAIPDAERVPRHWVGLLSAEEQASVARKRIPLDARRTLTSRACLRLLLASYLDVQPAAIGFTTTAQGKPQVGSPTMTTPIEFNVSHSGDWVVLGFARGLPVGVDVECHRDLEFSELVKSFFSPQEREAWVKVPLSEHPRAFFSAWTRKEACLKALGLGLSKSLDSFSVAIGRDSPCELVWCSSDPAAPQRWLIAEIDIAPGYACTVATRSAATALHTFTFEPPSTAQSATTRAMAAGGSSEVTVSKRSNDGPHGGQDFLQNRLNFGLSQPNRERQTPRSFFSS